MYYAAMEIYLITTLNQEKRAAEIRKRESGDKCSERVAACEQCPNEQEHEVARNTQSSYRLDGERRGTHGVRTQR